MSAEEWLRQVSEAEADYETDLWPVRARRGPAVIALRGERCGGETG